MKKHQAYGGFFLAIVLCGLLLRLLSLGRSGLSLEEIIYFSACTSDTAFDFSRHTAFAVYQSPLFYITGRFWLQCVHGELMIRLVSCLFGVTALGLLYPACRHLMSRAGALSCMALCALCPYHIYISQRFLPYSMMFFFLILNTYCFLSMSRKGLKWYLIAGFFLSAVAAIGAHSYSLLSALAQLAYFYVVPVKKNRLPVRYWFRWWLIIALVYLFVFCAVIGSLDLTVVPDKKEWAGISFKQIYHMLFIVPYGMSDGNRSFSLIYIITGMLFLFCMYRGSGELAIRRKDKSLRFQLHMHSVQVTYCGILFLVQTVIPFVIMEFLPVLYLRQANATGILLPCIILTGSGLQHIHGRFRQLLVMILIVLMFGGALLNYYYLHLTEEQFFMLIR